MTSRVEVYAGAVVCMLLGLNDLRADDAADVQQQLRRLQQQNEALQEQLHRQQMLIDSLTRKVGEIESTTSQRGRELQDLASEAGDQ
jgi:septal ring factor EnvC (AmiA/AmiB activator)